MYSALIALISTVSNFFSALVRVPYFFNFQVKLSIKIAYGIQADVSSRYLVTSFHGHFVPSQTIPSLGQFVLPNSHFVPKVKRENSKVSRSLRVSIEWPSLLANEVGKLLGGFFFKFSEKILLRLKFYLPSLPLERSDYLVERSDQRMEQSGLERSGHGSKWL